MREKKIKLFTFDELSDAAKRKALEQGSERIHNSDIAWRSEILDSLKGLFKACNGITLKDYDLGGQGSYLKVQFSEDDAAELRGARAIAWLENNLLSSLRIPFKGVKRDSIRKYGSAYWPGMIPPCPFTGYCADVDYLNELVNDVRGGMPLKDAFKALADVYTRLIEQEYDWQTSDEFLKEDFEANGTKFTEDGSIY